VLGMGVFFRIQDPVNMHELAFVADGVFNFFKDKGGQVRPCRWSNKRVPKYACHVLVLVRESVSFIQSVVGGLQLLKHCLFGPLELHRKI
jgi:hypothetical protein